MDLLKYTLAHKNISRKIYIQIPLQPWTANKPNTFNIKNQHQEPKFY